MARQRFGANLMLLYARALIGAVSSFVPVTRTYTTGTSATETVPAGATSCNIRDVGAGGAGGHDGTFLPGGGGSGGYALRSIAVTGGNTFTYTVGVGGAGNGDQVAGGPGTASTVSGTVAGGTVSMSGGGGNGGGNNGAFGSGGTATGGTTNTAGNPGSASQTGGAAVYSTYGKGGDGNLTSFGLGGAGGKGAVIFEYT